MRLGLPPVPSLDAFGCLWDVMLEALNDGGGGRDAVQMIDSTIVRAHQHAAGAKKGALRSKVLAVRVVATRPRSI
jgi:hypothetical protein